MKGSFYEVSRDGGITVRERVDRAIRAFCQRHEGRLPGSVVVSREEVGDAAAAVAELGFKKLVVEGNGGCLVTEVWLEVGIVSSLRSSQ